MKYHLADKEAFNIVGIMKRVPLIYKGVNPQIMKMWEGLDEEVVRILKGLADIEPLGFLSASTHFSEGRLEGGELDHYIGIATRQNAPVNLTQLAVPALTWAVFESIRPFPDTLQNIWGRIYAEWFPSSSLEQAPGLEILWNENKDLRSPVFNSEIWIPVMQRKNPK